MFPRDGIGALRLALAEGEILAGRFVERDHQVIRRYAGRRGDTGVDVFQQRKPRLLRPPLDEKTCTLVAMVKRLWSAISLPRSQVEERRSS